MSGSSSAFLLLNSANKIKAASDIELATALSNILSLSSRGGRGLSNTPFTFPSFSLETISILVHRFVGDHHNNKKHKEKNEKETINNTIVVDDGDVVSFFCNQQLKVLITTYFVTAAKNYGYSIQSWFVLQQQQTSSSTESITVESLVPPLLKALGQDSHSLVAGEILRLFLHFSPAFLQAFVFYYNNDANSNDSNSSSKHQLRLFENTSFGIIAPMLTETASALRNHAAWQVLFAALQTDIETLRPSREVVEVLAKNHLHSFLNLITSCLRHSNPASRRFALRLISDMLQLFSDWNPISHCLLQSPAIFFALLANTEGPPCAEHWQVYHILKMFIMFPKKCPLMRHLCYINRDSLGQYATSCVSKFSGHPKELSMIMSKLASMTPLTSEEAALIQCAL